MTDSPSDSSVVSTSPTREDRDGISVFDLLLMVIHRRRWVLWTLAVTVACGLLYIVVSSPTYQSTAQVVRESQDETPAALSGGLSALQGLGLSVGSITGGLSPDAYPKILESLEVRLAVARDTFDFPEHGRMTPVERLQADPSLVSRLLERLRGPEEEEAAVSRTLNPGIFNPSPEEIEAAKYVGDLISSSIDRETGLMAITVTTSNPQLSASVATRAMHHLRERVRELRTEKSRQNLTFIEERYEEAKAELREAEAELSAFVDQNQGLSTAMLQTQRDRLQRMVRFKSSVYSELQSQLTRARLDVQRNSPVITIVERPVPPLEPSNPSALLMVVLSVILGGAVGTGLAVLHALLTTPFSHDEERQKALEILDFLRSLWVIRKLEQLRS